MNNTRGGSDRGVSKFVICGLSVCALLVSGCATNSGSPFGVSRYTRTEQRATLAAANVQFNNEEFEMIDLIEALDPYGLRKKKGLFDEHKVRRAGGDDPETSWNDGDAQIERNRLEQALHAFHLPEYAELGSPRERRNRIQDRLLAASEARCNAYKQYLKDFETHWETSLGIMGTILGAAGAIATGDLNTRAFAGLAAMATGTRAELRQGVFRNLASYVVVPGIDRRRAEVLKEIHILRAQPIADYTVQAAIHDAAKYHGACALDVGLDAARDSIQLVDNPGFVQLTRSYLQLSELEQARRILDKARGGTLEAKDAKIVSTEYTPTTVVLAGARRAADGKGDAMTAPQLSNHKEVFGEAERIAKTSILVLEGLNKDEKDQVTAGLRKGWIACLKTLLGDLTEKSLCKRDKDDSAQPPTLTIPEVQHSFAKKVASANAEISTRSACLEFKIVKSGNTASRPEELAQLTVQRATLHATVTYINGMLENSVSKPFRAGTLGISVSDVKQKPAISNMESVLKAIDETKVLDVSTVLGSQVSCQ